MQEARGGGGGLFGMLLGFDLSGDKIQLLPHADVRFCQRLEPLFVKLLLALHLRDGLAETLRRAELLRGCFLERRRQRIAQLFQPQDSHKHESGASQSGRGGEGDNPNAHALQTSIKREGKRRGMEKTYRFAHNLFYEKENEA